jgi:hypothetical protein
MRLIPLVAAVAAFVVPAAPAFAGDPVMPLSQVQTGMRCTGFSVVQGTTISSFDVLVLDVAAGEASDGVGRILIEASGPAVDATGIGPGFSGSPIYCPDAEGVSRNIGAISESVMEYGGKVVLATPIEAIIGTAVDPPGPPSAASPPRPAAARTGAAVRSGATASPARVSPRMRHALERARPLASPLTVSGVSGPVARSLAGAGVKAGRPVLAVPPGPLGAFPPQTLQPGSAVAVGYSTGDVRTSSVGTVAYVDGDRVWAFGHALEAGGRRALLLQDAYVFRVVNNPLQLGQIGTTYKLAASGHDLGTISSDGFSAVAGRTGVLPHTVPVTVIGRDLDSGGITTVRVSAADEAAVDLPSGGSWTSFVAPLTVAQAAGQLLGSTPARVTGEMCVRIGVAQLKRPLRFCNRYVSVAAGQEEEGEGGNALLSGIATDLGGALSTIDAYTGSPPTVTGVNVLLKLRRGAAQAFIRDVRLPASARAGQRVRARVELQRVRGGRLTRTYTVRIPSGTRRGTQRLRFIGEDADQGEEGFATIILGEEDERDQGGDPGPRSLNELANEVRDTQRYDGVMLRVGRARSKAFRDDEFRISGQAEARIRIRR